MVGREGVRKMHVMEVVGAAPVLGPLFALATSLTDGSVEAVEPEVVVASLVRLC